jgi:hypothetical protein
VISIIEMKLNEFENASIFEIEEINNSDKVISIYLDDQSTTEWKVLSETENGYELLLGGIFRIKMK